MVQKALQAVPNAKFTIAAAFGNVHGVYAGQRQARPEDPAQFAELHRAAAGIPNADGSAKPCSFVFHGGSGSDLGDIREAISYGVIKMNIDTDTQWAYWDGIRRYSAEHAPYLHTQIGNPDGPDKPNKKFYDPRMPVRAAEASTVDRLGQCFADLNCVDIF